MSDQDIFDAQGNPVTPVATPDPVVAPIVEPSPNLFVDQLAVIKNEDGLPKYDSVPKALDALAQSQLYIQKLEGEAATNSTEMVGLREQVAKNAVVEDVVARLTAQNNDTPVQETPQPKVVDEAAVLDMVRNALNQDRTAEKSKENVSLVQTTIVGKYGEKASEAMAAKAVELGTSLESLKKLSAESPALVIALFDGAKAPVDNPTSSSVTLNLTPKGPVPLEKPTKSLLAGATSKEQTDFMDRVREDVHAKHNVET